MDIEEHNRSAWDQAVENENRWTVPVSSNDVQRARRGDWRVVLTPTRPVPPAWFGEIVGRQVLCLASAGGQQAPILAAAGAHVTVLDNSPRQLERDQEVALRDALVMNLELGSMCDLSRFADASFDLVFHPVANLFVADVRPVWHEVYRVLRPGGTLLAGVSNPVSYLFDWERQERTGELCLRYTLPYSDVAQLPPEQLEARLDADEAVEFGHTLSDQIGGQLQAGFVLMGFYEDVDPENPLSDYTPTFVATRAQKPE